MKIISFILWIFCFTFPLSCQQEDRPQDQQLVLRTLGTALLSSIVGEEFTEKLEDFSRVSQRAIEFLVPYVQNSPTIVEDFIIQQTRFIFDPFHRFLEPFDAQRKYPQHLLWITCNPYKFSIKDYEHDLSLKMGQALYGSTLPQRIAKRVTLTERSREIFLNLYAEKSDRIPHITHRCWITSSTSPKEPSKKYIQAYLDSLKKLTGRWNHNFWCMNPDDIPQTIATLRQSKIPIQIRRIEEIYPQMQAKHVFDAYYQDNQFCFANDISRQNIVYLEGGVYSDLGTLFLEDLTPFVDAYDCLLSKELFTIDQCFFAYQKGNAIFKEYLSVLHTLYQLPQKTKDMTKTPREKQGWHTPPLLMACLDHFSQPTDRVLFVPNGRSSLTLIDHGGSWNFRAASSGNKSIFESQLDILSVRPNP